ncbi:MAG: GntR family transcriptional regulator [Parvibaculaceae bacterium]
MTLRRLAVEKLRAAILQFHFAPGERLIERRLCEELGVSRTVVREALRQLETEGLIETTPHRGPAVSVLDRAVIEQIYELRMSLEAIAARACALSGRDVADRLYASLQAIEHSYETSDVHRTLEETTNFYETMFLTGGKSVAWEIERNLNARINALRALTMTATGRSHTGPAEMRRIVDAIRDKDPDAAEAASRRHVEQALAIAIERLADPRQQDMNPIGSASDRKNQTPDR